MENKKYEIGGFAFGDNGLFQLTIKTINHTNSGTSTSLELGIELNPDERQELIKVLINAGEQN